MNKKLISVAFSIALLASPLVTSAQSASTSNSGIIAILEQLVATLTQELEQLIASRGQSTTSTNLSASPASGTAPLTVTFSGGGTGGNPADGPFINFGDGSKNVQMSCTSSSSGACVGTYTATHVYASNGTYTAQVISEATGAAFGSANVTVAGTTANSSCASFSSLYKGETDAATGGQVTQAQTFLGINPTTGYYGAQTSIAYQNKCGNLGNAQPTYVAGMSKYTDSDFGFSFWYPSSWSVNKQTDGSYVWFTLSDSSGNNQLSVSEDTETGGVFSDDACNAGTGNRGVYFDSQSGAWMTGGNIADISQNTMGGLHMLTAPCIVDNTADTVVPLSANKFVHVTRIAAGISVRPLASTIVATNPAVAIPVSTAQQTATIQAEANAYGGVSDTVPNTSQVQMASYLASQSSTGFIASPTYGNAPLTVSFNMPAFFSVNGNEVAWTTIDNGDGEVSISGNPTSEAYDNVSCNAAAYSSTCLGTHTYSSPGTYIVKLEDVSGNLLATQIVTVSSSSVSNQPSPSIRITNVSGNTVTVQWNNLYDIQDNNSPPVTLVVQQDGFHPLLTVSVNPVRSGSATFSIPSNATAGEYNIFPESANNTFSPVNAGQQPVGGTQNLYTSFTILSNGSIQTP
jgi:hypothetical protein